MQSITAEKIPPRPLQYIPLPPIVRPRFMRALLWNIAGSFTIHIVAIVIQIALHLITTVDLRLIFGFARSMAQDYLTNGAGFAIALLLLQSRAIGMRKPFYIAAFIAGAASDFGVLLAMKVAFWIFENGPSLIRYKMRTIATTTQLATALAVSLALLGIAIQVANARRAKPEPESELPSL